MRLIMQLPTICTRHQLQLSTGPVLDQVHYLDQRFVHNIIMTPYSYSHKPNPNPSTGCEPGGVAKHIYMYNDKEVLYTQEGGR